jgi:hypothetical protein
MDPEVILRDDGEARIIEDTPDGNGVTDACEGGSRLDLCCWRLMSHYGRQLSWFYQQIRHGYMCMAVCGGGEHGGAIRGGSSTSFPSFRSCSGGRILCAAIIHCNGSKCSVTLMVLNLTSRAPPRRLIKAPGVGIMTVPGGYNIES